MFKVDLVITNPDGQQATLTQAFEFRYPAPTVSGVAPAAGAVAGGDTVTIAGTGFQAGATVTFGGRPAVVQSVSPTEIVVLTPSML